jgi:hypothetical protein
LQTNQFSDNDTINIVLTDSAKLIYQYTIPNPVISIDPYSTDLRWIAEPSVPGIYYCACEYLPRIVTFLECIANFARGDEENLKHPIRLIIDFPPKFWRNESVIGQMLRLNYISSSFSYCEFRPLTLWSVFTSLKDLSPQTKIILDKAHLVIVKPIPQSWLKEITNSLEKQFAHLKNINNIPENKEGFFYLPYTDTNIYSQNSSSLNT